LLVSSFQDLNNRREKESTTPSPWIDQVEEATEKRADFLECAPQG